MSITAGRRECFGHKMGSSFVFAAVVGNIFLFDGYLATDKWKRD
jgi:hypothetical protein